jgi:hypothetical protein
MYFQGFVGSCGELWANSGFVAIGFEVQADFVGRNSRPSRQKGAVERGELYG